MKAEQAKKIADQALSQLAESLPQGRSQELTRYLDMMARFHHYSFGNICLILSQRPDATRVAGFNRWKQIGRYVKKGEKGIVIIAPMALRTREAEEAKPQAEESSTRTVLRFRGVFVFDISQTDGEPLPTPASVQGDPAEYLPIIKAAVTGRGIVLDYEAVPSGASGVSRGGRISIKPGLEPAEEFAVIAHEFAHELLHRGEDRPTSKTVRETEAEAVAYVVSRSIGLNAASAARDYIQLYNGDAATLAQSLDRIQHVAADIITAINAPQDAQNADQSEAAEAEHAASHA